MVARSKKRAILLEVATFYTSIISRAMHRSHSFLYLNLFFMEIERFGKEFLTRMLKKCLHFEGVFVHFQS